MDTNKQYNFIKMIIERHKLQPSVRRVLPLFSLSCLSLAFTVLLKKKIGFSWEIMAILGGRNDGNIMVNEKRIANLVRKYLKENFLTLDEKLFQPAQGIFKQAQNSLI